MWVQSKGSRILFLQTLTYKRGGSNLIRQQIIREFGLTTVRKPLREAGYDNMRPPSHLHVL